MMVSPCSGQRAIAVLGHRAALTGRPRAAAAGGAEIHDRLGVIARPVLGRQLFGQRLHLLAEQFLLPEVLGALDRRLLEERLAAGANLRLHRLVALPELPALLARDRADLVPLVLDLAQLLGHDRHVGLVAQRLEAADERFLHAGVGPALPLVGLAQILDAREQQRLDGLQPADDALLVLAGGLAARAAYPDGLYAELIQNRSFEEGVLPQGMKVVKKPDGTEELAPPVMRVIGVMSVSTS